MDAVTSVTLELGDELDKSGGTHPSATFTADIELTELPDHHEDFSYSTILYTYEWRFRLALCSIPLFLAGEPAKIFAFESTDWWALPRDDESVNLARKSSFKEPDTYSPIPVEKAALARALVSYCTETRHFERDPPVGVRPLQCARQSIQLYEDSSSLPERRLFELGIVAVLQAGWDLVRTYEVLLGHLTTPERLAGVLERIRNCDDEAATAAYTTLLEEADPEIVELTLERLRAEPDGRLFDAAAEAFPDDDDLGAELALTLFRTIESLPPDDNRRADLGSAVVEMTFHDDPRVRRQTARILTRSEDSWKRDGIEILTDDEDGGVRQIARAGKEEPQR